MVVTEIVRSHVHIYDITNIFQLFFWIKLNLKMPKFLTVPVVLVIRGNRKLGQHPGSAMPNPDPIECERQRAARDNHEQ